MNARENHVDLMCNSMQRHHIFWVCRRGPVRGPSAYHWHAPVQLPTAVLTGMNCGLPTAVLPAKAVLAQLTVTTMGSLLASYHLSPPPWVGDSASCWGCS